MAADIYAVPGADLLRVTIGLPLPSVVMPERPPDVGILQPRVGLVLDFHMFPPGLYWNAPCAQLQAQSGWLFNRGTTYNDDRTTTEFIELQTPEPNRVIDSTIRCGCIAEATLTNVQPGQGRFTWTLADVLVVASRDVAIPTDPDTGLQRFTWAA